MLSGATDCVCINRCQSKSGAALVSVVRRRRVFWVLECAKLELARGRSSPTTLGPNAGHFYEYSHRSAPLAVCHKKV